MGARTSCTAPGNPRENSFIESFDVRQCDELLHCEVLHTLREAELVIEGWR